MWLHISFTNGSNPFFQMYKRNGEHLQTKKDVTAALRRWKRHYNIVGYWTDGGYMAWATEKED